jgi:cobalt/nickel transport system permease protein
MADIRSKINEIYSLESLSEQNTFIHRIHPLAKILVTVVYIVCVAIHGRYELFSLTPFLFYPMIIISLAEIPYKFIFKRTLIALPFVMFAGLSNIIFDESVYMVGNIKLSGGLISCFAILMRTFLCVSAVLMLIATTRFDSITKQLKRMHIPTLFLCLIEMIYRYINVLAEEAETMLVAYRLRNTGKKWIAIKDMGTFLGHLFFKSIDRSERIYSAMKCRGYSRKFLIPEATSMKAGDYIYIIIWCVLSVACTVLV